MVAVIVGVELVLGVFDEVSEKGLIVSGGKGSAGGTGGGIVAILFVTMPSLMVGRAPSKPSMVSDSLSLFTLGRLERTGAFGTDLASVGSFLFSS